MFQEAISAEGAPRPAVVCRLTVYTPGPELCVQRPVRPAQNDPSTVFSRAVGPVRCIHLLLFYSFSCQREGEEGRDDEWGGKRRDVKGVGRDREGSQGKGREREGKEKIYPLIPPFLLLEYASGYW